MKKYLLFLLFSFFGIGQLLAQSEGYNILLTVKGLNKGIVKFGYYYGENAYLLDSMQVDSASHSVHFVGKRKLEGGMYFLALPNARPIDIVIADDATFEASTAVGELIDSLSFQGTQENEAYVLYQKKLNRYSKQMEQIEFNRSLLQRATRDPEAFKPLQETMIQERKALELYQEIFIKDYPKLFCTKLLKASETPKVPDKIKATLENKTPNPAFYQYVRMHYWDNVDFSDYRLLRTKIIANKLTIFMQQLTFPQLDSIKQSADFIVKKAEQNTKMKAYLLQTLFARFDNNYAPNADRVLLHLVDTYFPNEKDTTYADLGTLARIRFKADMNRPNLTGAIAKDIRLMRPDSSYLSLHAIESPFTLLYFYSPLCSHCQEKLPIVQEVFNKYKDKGVVCYAVATDREVAYWKQYVVDKKMDWFNVIDPNKSGTWEKDFTAFNLPVIYLLDKDKKILLKRIAPEQLDKVLQAVLSQPK
jgi:thiol-disulfide isomerase/thioredoxin